LSDLLEGLGWEVYMLGGLSWRVSYCIKSLMKIVRHV
jgi:hypothetical protein